MKDEKEKERKEHKEKIRKILHSRRTFREKTIKKKG
jgi:hypothetical protein